MYEKSNSLDQILKKGEEGIANREDEIRMLNIKLKEQERKLEIAKKEILAIPTLSMEVVDLKQQLEEKSDQVKRLARQLEDPNQSLRRRELSGDDPDPESLEAKIQV